tara:strand:+ start:32285 stop:32434 length:150 start_codon:yes stop_codon:yes gene_type:complete
LDTIALAAERELAEYESSELHNTTYVGPYCALWDNPNLTVGERDAMIPF